MGYRSGRRSNNDAVHLQCNRDRRHPVGATPVLVDIREGDFNIDPEQIESAITPRTKVIIPVDFGGEPCAMDAIMEIGNRRGVRVLSDAAHSVGSSYRGRHCR